MVVASSADNPLLQVNCGRASCLAKAHFGTRENDCSRNSWVCRRCGRAQGAKGNQMTMMSSKTVWWKILLLAVGLTIVVMAIWLFFVYNDTSSGKVSSKFSGNRISTLNKRETNQRRFKIMKREVIEVQEEQWRNETYLNNFLLQLKREKMIDEKSSKTLHKLIDDRTLKNFNKILYNDHIFSQRDLSDTLLKNNMTEFTSQMNFEMKFVVAYNDTTIMLTRRINRFYYWEFAQNASGVVIFCMIVVGNLSILHRLKSCRRRRSNVNYFIVQLAIADLFVGFFSITLDATLRYHKEFTYGLYACKLAKYISILFIYSSTYLLVALSFDRWEAVVKPLAFTQNRSRGYYLVGGSWLLALICAAPVTYKTVIKKIEDVPQCYIDYDIKGWKLYMIYLTVSLLIVPALVIAVCYAHIVYTIWSKGRQVAKQQRDQNKCLAKRPNASSAKCRSIGGEPSGEQRKLTGGNKPPVIVRSASKSAGDKLIGRHVQRAELGTGEPKNGGAGQLISVALDSQQNHSTVRLQEELSQDTEEEVDYTSTEEDEDDDEEEQQVVDKRLFKQPSGRSSNGFEMHQILAEDNRSLSNGHGGQVRVCVENTRDSSETINAKEKSTETQRNRDLLSSELDEQTLPEANSEIVNRVTGKKAKQARRSYVAHQHGSGVIPKARIKTIKMTLVIVAAFLLCWSPFYIINLCSVFGLMKGDSGITVALATLSQSLAHLNSAVNPIIFWIFSSKRSNNTLASSSDARNSHRITRKITRWTSIKQFLCFKQCSCCCCCCLDNATSITTDSRMFDSTRNSNVSGSIRLPSSIQRKLAGKTSEHQANKLQGET